MTGAALLILSLAALCTAAAVTSLGPRRARPTRPRLAAGCLAAATLLATGTACSTDGDESAEPDEGGRGATAGETTNAAPTTTAPLGPPDRSLEPALLTPRDLPEDMWEWPFGTRDEYRLTTRDRARIDDVTISPGPCTQVVGSFLASTGAGPSIRELTSTDDRLVIEQRVDREPDAADRFDALAEDLPDACGEAILTATDRSRADASAGNFHIVDADVTLQSLAVVPGEANDPTSTSPGTPLGFVLFVRDAARVHVLSAFTNASPGVISRDGLYDLAVHVAAAAQHKLSATAG